MPSPHSPAEDPRGLIDELTRGFAAAAAETVPWYLAQMPKSYFEDTSAADRRWHLRAIIAARSSDLGLNLMLKSGDGRTLTAIREGNKPGALAEIVRELPLQPPLLFAKIHSSRDGALIVDSFEFGDAPPGFDPSNPEQAAKAAEKLAWASTHARDLDPHELRAHIAHCPADYILTVSPLRFARQRRMFMQVSGSDGALVEIEPESERTESRITIAVANARTRTILERTASVLAKAEISIVRAYLDLMKDPPHGVVTMVGYVVQTAAGTAIDEHSVEWQRVAHELRRARWVDDRVLDLERRIKSLDLDGAEAFSAFAALVHQRLVAKDPVAYNHARVWATLEEHMVFTQRGLDLFARRFDPSQDLGDAEFAAALATLRRDGEARALSENAKLIFLTLCDAIAAVRRTNAFVPGRFALALRLDPEFMVAAPRRPERPFGVFFVHGRGFNGFHVRFKEIARGGLRVIHPTASRPYERANEELYDEVYGLAFTQQLKNKDIPEGGAKAAVAVEVGAEATRCVQAFTDAILDLITPEASTRGRVRDRLDLEEFIYLGPDENITPAHIEWIVARARRRGYPLANAFMSSKPGAGINHKVYGVTSEGVNVFLEMGLKARGIDPRSQTFTIKIKGGPDGDVAGNMLRILHRDYGNNAKIVSIGDGSGCGEDPAGLDHDELLRLFRDSKPIAAFDPRRLSPKGRIIKADTADGRHLRDTSHNRFVTDAFVPGGGLRETMNARNWRDFLTADGKLSSSVIVEGANLFLTPEARVELHQLGALIFKDSSANKCGVICSSYEIQASMLLDDAAFLAIKDQYVAEVLAKLREFARREAALLLAESRRHTKTPLSELSVQVSEKMNAAADLVHRAVRDWPTSHPLYREVVLGHVPAILAKTVGERLFTDLPKPYLDWLVAKALSSRIVYREGIDFFASIDAESVSAVVQRYVEKERDLRRLVAAVRGSGIADAARAADILDRAGPRAATFEV
jgi:glutamate dehydrogenase